MSEELLWYAARVSGLMAWILSFGALASGLLARSEPAHGTTAGQWAGDTRNLLARLAVVALGIHTAATVAAERFDLTLVSALSARQDGRWLGAAMVLGVICGLFLVAVEVWRLLIRSLPPVVDLVLLLVSAGVVAGGAYHGWQLGSDTQNTLAVVIVVLCAVLLFAAAAIGLTTVISGSTGPVPMDQGKSPFREVRDVRRPNNAAFDTKLSVSLSRRVDGQVESALDRGPEIASARDVSVPEVAGQGSPPRAEQTEEDSAGSWSMRKLPDAPKPAHRKRKNR